MNRRLRALVQRVWGPNGGSSPVAVTTGPPPDGYVAVETYAVVPDLAHARYLVPLDSRRAGVATLWTYHTMRAPTRRAAEAVVSTLFRAHCGDSLFRRRLVVSIDSRVPNARHADWLLLAHLARELDRPRLFAGLAVRRVQPSSKPMLELFDRAGEPLGFAKLGWSPATNNLVRAEIDTLEALKGRLRRVVAPRPLSHGYFNGHAYSVVSPLARGLRRCESDPVVACDAPLKVATSAAVSHGPVDGSAYATRLRQALGSTATAAPSEFHVLDGWLARLERDPTPLRYGRWHGDWVPHNLARTGETVAAWDWEHSSADTPIGFDALHWHFQRALPLGGLAAGVYAVDRASARLGGYGASPATGRLLASLYLLEMFVRGCVLAVGGGGWNLRVHPGMLEVAAWRDRDARESA